MDVYDEVDRRETDAGDLTCSFTKLLFSVGGGKLPACVLLAQLLLSS